ncbi:MAG: hypothetical protein ACR2P1_11410 [Pseudomonadales bacterium]
MRRTTSYLPRVLWRERNRTLLLVFALLVQSVSVSAQCPADETQTGDMVLSTQQQVDAIAQNPFTRLVGHLEISGADIDNLDALICLERVEGLVEIHDNPQLQSADGLRHVRSVAGDLILYSNAALQIAGFADLTSVGGGLQYFDNPSLESLVDLANLEHATFLSFYSLESLSAITEFERLGELPGGLYIGSNRNLEKVRFSALEGVGFHLIIDNHEKLKEIDMGALRHVDSNGTLMIHFNPYLEQLNLDSLQKIEGGLIYTQNASLERLLLESVLEIGENVVIEHNKYLKEVNLSGIQQAGTLLFSVVHHPLLSKLQIGNLKDLTSLVLTQNDALTELDLSKVESVEQDLIVRDNESLEALDLGQLHTVGLHFKVEDHPKLNNFILGEITELGDDIDETPNDFIVRRNPHLNSCHFVEMAARLGLWGHNNFDFTPNEIDISNNEDSGMATEILVSSQQQLDEFTGVECVSGHIWLADGSFTDVSTPLKNLQFVAGKLRLTNSQLPEGIELPEWRFGGDYLEVSYVSGLRELQLLALEFLSDMSVVSQDVLTVRAPRLRYINRHLVIYMNPEYDELSFNFLDGVGNGIMILENPALPHGQVVDLLNDMSDVPGWLVFCGNQSGPPC